jgi:hypothetical protein
MDIQKLQPSTIVSDIELTAMQPVEMINAQQQLITWCDLKLSSLRHESDELKLSYEHARKMHWKHTTLQNQYNKSVKRIQYYEKMKAAMLQGYYIVPNFPIQMFAIKTKGRLLAMDTNSYWGDKTQSEQELPIGEGEYKNPFPIVERKVGRSENGKEIEKPFSYASDWDEFEFPITMAKPKIMEATSYAMALKIFDRIGIMPAAKKEDPVIIGQIINKNGYRDKVVSFMIAWHLNTNVL